MTGQSWQDWLHEQRVKSTMTVEQTPLVEESRLDPGAFRSLLKGWIFKRPWTNLVVFAHSGSFFEVVGVRIRSLRTALREWSQPMFKQPGPPGTVCLVYKNTGIADPYHLFLVRAHEEGGNDPEKRFVMLSASVQASPSNLARTHGGPAPQRADLIPVESSGFKFAQDQQQDSGRFLNKKVKIMLIERPDLEELELIDNERIFTLRELREAVLAGECNSHLCEAMAYFEIWSNIGSQSGS